MQEQVVVTGRKVAISLRIGVDLKRAADIRAVAERRNLTSYIEWLIMTDAKQHNLLKE